MRPEETIKKNPHLHLINVLQEGSYVVLVIKLGIKHDLMCPQRFAAQKKAGAAVLFQSSSLNISGQNIQRISQLVAILKVRL